jgi:cytochrome d ubiquinol oxidase subunit I
MDALTAHRFHFAFTVSYHYLFPQLTMGLALLIVVLKAMGLRGDERAEEGARFFTRLFVLFFAMGVVTGIPMEFQFGTSWARFSEAAGGVVAQTLAMEGVFAFILESAFLGLLLLGEDRLGKKLHFAVACMVFLGTWLSGYFIVTTNAFMQHPVGHEVLADGSIALKSLGAYLTNPWALVQYAHTMVGSVVTAATFMAAIGAYYRLHDEYTEHADRFLKVGVIAGVIGSLLATFPTGDFQAKLTHDHKPAAFAAMEGHFHTEEGAPLALIGQPDVESMELDNPLYVPGMLSFLTHKRWDSEITGLSEIPQGEWPDNIPLLYYAYHVMVGLGTLLIALFGLATFALFRRKLGESRFVLWLLMLALPFPFVANTAGWMTAELGRQPWLLHGLMRTADGYSANVSGGNAVFTLLGFMGLYALLSLLALMVFLRIIRRGPLATESH